MKLFSYFQVGTHYVHVNLKLGVDFPSHRSSSVHVTKPWAGCKLLDENVAVLTDDTGKVVLV